MGLRKINLKRVKRTKKTKKINNNSKFFYFLQAIINFLTIMWYLFLGFFVTLSLLNLIFVLGICFNICYALVTNYFYNISDPEAGISFLLVFPLFGFGISIYKKNFFTTLIFFVYLAWFSTQIKVKSVILLYLISYAGWCAALAWNFFFI